MSEELDRRVAVEVMGEQFPIEWPTSQGAFSEGGYWRVVCAEGKCWWQPLPFSTDFDQAMRAVDTVLDELRSKYEDAMLEIDYNNYSEPYFTAFVRWLLFDQCYDECKAEDNDLSTAICRALLAYVETREL